MFALTLALAPLGARADTGLAPPLPASTASRPNVYLSWVRLAGADSCPDVRQIADDVTRRLGWNPFREAPTQFIEGQIRRDEAGDMLAGRVPGTWVAEIFLRDASGVSRGNRVFTSAAPSCGTLASAVALSIAIIIDPDVMVRRFSDEQQAWPGSPAAPPRSSPRAGDASGTGVLDDDSNGARAPRPVSAARGTLMLLGAGALRLLPRFAPALGLQGEVRVGFATRLALKAGGVLLPEVRTPEPDDTFAFGMTAGWLGACFDVLQRDPVMLGVCAAGTVGVLHPVVYSPDPIRPGERTFWGATSGLRAGFRLSARVEAQLGVDGVFVLNRRQFTVNDRPAGMDVVFTQPAAAALIWLGIGARFR